MREDVKFRHGHIYEHGDYVLPHAYDNAWIIFDQKQYQRFLEEKQTGKLKYQKLFEKMVKADSITILANKTNLPAENLENTVKEFNHFAENGKDIKFGRAPETLEKFDNGPFYAIKLAPAVLNTQGGPEHDKQARVLDTNNKAIPHLFSAGELGGMCVNRYQGGGNLAECLIFGKIAGGTCC